MTNQILTKFNSHLYVVNNIKFLSFATLTQYPCSKWWGQSIASNSLILLTSN